MAIALLSCLLAPPFLGALALAAVHLGLRHLEAREARRKADAAMWATVRSIRWDAERKAKLGTDR